MAKPIIKRLALLNPLGDFGIDTYTHELAQGLAANGVEVDVFVDQSSKVIGFHSPEYRLLPVLGGPIVRQSRTLNAKGSIHPIQGSPATAKETMHKVNWKASLYRSSKLFRSLRDSALALELAWFLRCSNYDVIWTQWPDIYGIWFWQLCRLFHLRTVHTVHNVLPHEEHENDKSRYGQVYKSADLLFVHSNYAHRELVKIFPTLETKVVQAWHGTYSVFRRCPEVRYRVRKELSISPGDVVLLFCGAVRPYKNIDSVLAGMRGKSGIVLVVVGEESGYPDLDPSDKLGRTRKLVEEMKLGSRFAPGFVSSERLAELLEAADILALAYTKHYGSGLLALGMTFGIHILATKVGGADEYLSDYPCCTLIPSAAEGDVSEGLTRAMSALREGHRRCTPDARFGWNNIARQSLEAVQHFFFENRARLMPKPEAGAGRKLL